jgi:hypothetical protein
MISGNSCACASGARARCVHVWICATDVLTRTQVLISNETTYAIALMLTAFRYTVAPPIIDIMKGVKNEVEVQGLRRAYTRDGACFVQFLAWLEETMGKGVQVRCVSPFPVESGYGH